MRRQLFEFMDLEVAPQSLRMCLRDILEVCNSLPFRRYYDAMVEHIERLVSQNKFSEVVELGAGNAPLSRRLALSPKLKDTHLRITDLNPDPVLYRELAEKYPGQVVVTSQSVDFSRINDWQPNSLVVLSVTFHHLPHAARIKTIKSLEASGVDFVIGEALRHNMASALLCLLGGVFVGLMAPLFLLQKPNNLRRFFWCWIVPFAPVLFVWDGVISAWRTWSTTEWHLVAQSLEMPRYDLRTSLFTSVFTVRRR